MWVTVYWILKVEHYAQFECFSSTSNLTTFIRHSIYQKVIRKTCVRFEVHAAVTVKNIIIWDTSPWSRVEFYLNFGGTCWSNHMSWRISQSNFLLVFLAKSSTLKKEAVQSSEIKTNYMVSLLNKAYSLIQIYQTEWPENNLKLSSNSSKIFGYRSYKHYSFSEWLLMVWLLCMQRLSCDESSCSTTLARSLTSSSGGLLSEFYRPVALCGTGEVTARSQG
jgi:hypothetical protein